MSEPEKIAEVDLNSLRVQVEGLNLEENQLGHGSYGIVYAVTVDGRKCIAKKLHNILIHYARYAPQGQNVSIVRKFLEECRVLSQLKHPNVVGFVGVHYGHDIDRNNISLIMERLHCDLADYVEKNPDTRLCDRLHILYDVSEGLDYLHSQTPPLVHRDLTAPNVLLTEDLTAKIGDLGVSRYVDPSVDTKLTASPGNSFYMPPESKVENPTYSTKLDIFSFGTLIVHTIIGTVPGVFEISSSDKLCEYVREGRHELMRRDTAVHKKMGGDTHCLYSLVVCCLHDKPEHRPPVGKVRSSLRELCTRHPRMTLLEACKTGNVEVVEKLLVGGADPNQLVDEELKATPLYWASRKGHNEVVRVLLAGGASVNTQNKYGVTPLWRASFHGHQKCVQLLIEAGAKVDIPKEDGWTALMVASRGGRDYYAIVRMLLKAKADVNMRNNENKTALHWASRYGHDKVIEVLLAAKATVNTQDKYGVTPLWLASFHGHQKCVQLLIEAGAKVDVPKEDGWTALMVASQEGHCATVRMLLKVQADVNMRNNSNQTALMIAAWKGHSSVVELLLSKGADPNLRNNEGATALHVACQNGHLKVTETLITAHASVNAQNKFNRTPLMWAAREGHSSVVELLLSKGADPNLRNNDGKTAYDLARVMGHSQLSPHKNCSIM